MALKDLLALADDKLHEIFERKPYNADRERKAMIKRIDKARDQHQSATPTKGKKIFKVQNGVAQITLPFEIAGKSTFHVPSERFIEWLDHLKDSVTKGELDKELEANSGHPGRTSTAPKVSKGRAGWSPERRAAFEAKKAKK